MLFNKRVSWYGTTSVCCKNNCLNKCAQHRRWRFILILILTIVISQKIRSASNVINCDLDSDAPYIDVLIKTLGGSPHLELMMHQAPYRAGCEDDTRVCLWLDFVMSICCWAPCWNGLPKVFPPVNFTVCNIYSSHE